MTFCPHCAGPMDSVTVSTAGRLCSHCRVPVAVDAGPDWIDVARVSNLAEAGFLSDELVGLGIDARVHQLDQFSALADHWATVYFIRVPRHLAAEAAARIRQHLAEDASSQDAHPGMFRFSDVDNTIDPTFWRPIALVVLAGVASFVLGQHFSDPNGRRSAQGNSLSSVVDRIGRPLLSEPAPGKPRHRLSFDRQRDAWYLDADLDGDGRFDGRQQFHASGAAW